MPNQLSVPEPPSVDLPFGRLDPQKRADTARDIRCKSAEFERKRDICMHEDNGDEAKYPNFIGNYSKGLPHNALGEVVPAEYQKLQLAAKTGQPDDFNKIHRSDVKQVNPLSGLAFDLVGADSNALCLPPARPVASPERAAEAVELYWMALCRDVPFSQYGKEPITRAAIADLNALHSNIFPTDGGLITPQTLFRGNTPGELTGPYISQFFLKAAAFGALSVTDPSGNPAQQYVCYQPGKDYMTDVTSWLNVQNGTVPTPYFKPNAPFGQNEVLGPRFLFNGRAGAAFVHVDELYQAYFMAALNLLDSMAAYDPSNPYAPNNPDSFNQVGFGTFGNPHIATLVAEVATRALKAQWFQKWFVHRTLRPEAYGGLVHFTMTAAANYPVDGSILKSDAVRQAFAENNSFLLPMAFPEGSPQHPSYGSGHATVAGACATIIKAYFDETMPITDPVQASPDGMSLVPYTGPDAGNLNVGTEANKIAGNVGMFRNHAGVHWRSDHEQSILLGEQIGISILQDQKWLYNETTSKDAITWQFTTFTGQKITI